MDKREYKELSELAANGGTKAFARLYETVYREKIGRASCRERV